MFTIRHTTISLRSQFHNLTMLIIIQVLSRSPYIQSFANQCQLSNVILGATLPLPTWGEQWAELMLPSMHEKSKLLLYT